MPMELYSSEAFVRDIVNAISKSEGRPMNIGGARHQGIERGYAYQLIAEAKKAVEGNFGTGEARASGQQPASRSEAIKTLMVKLDKQEASAKRAPVRTARKQPLPA